MFYRNFIEYFKARGEEEKMKIAITGGHLAPALAVIQKLSENSSVIFFGRKYAMEGDGAISLEYKTITKMGITFYEVKSGRLQRKFTRHTILSLAKIPFGIFQSLLILYKDRPDVVMTFGGYLSLPVAFAASVLRIPVIIHEQTLEAGLANKLLAPIATRICISWETSRKYFNSKKTVLTGNPIRSEFENPKESSELLKSIHHGEKFIYITGGSLGSHAINMLVEACLEKLLQKYIVVHQTGDAREYNDFARLENVRNLLDESLRSRYILTKFVDPMEVGLVMRKADLVVGRSGINTVTELLFLKKPAFLVPLPFAQAQEQRKNALFLKKVGLAEVSEQKDLTSDELYTTINHMMENLKSYHVSGGNEETEKLMKSAENILNVAAHVIKKN